MAEQPLGQRLRIGDPVQRGIQNPVAAVRDESMAVLVLAELAGPALRGDGGRLDRAPRRGKAERHHFDRQRKAAEHRHPFASSAITTMRAGGRGDDLFAQQRAAAALDQASGPGRSRRRRRRSGRARASRRAW